MQAPADIATIIETLAHHGARLTLTGLKGSAPSYLLSRLIAEGAGPLLIVAPTVEAATEAWHELRFFSGQEEEILWFPPWDTSPFEHATPHPEILGHRLHSLLRLSNGKMPAVITTVEALRQRTISRQLLGEVSQYLVAGEELEHDLLLGKLTSLGYLNVPLVEDRGTFSVRGGIIDIFPSDLPSPVRLEFFGDQVESIRFFDPITQRSLHPLPELVLVPSREFVLSEEILAGFSSRLKARCDELGLPAARRRELLEQLQHGAVPAGTDYLLPLIHPDLETLFDYLPKNTLRVLLDPEGLLEAEERSDREIIEGVARAEAKDQVIPPAEDLFLSRQNLHKHLGQGPQLKFPLLAVTESAVSNLAYTTETNGDLKIDVAAETEGVFRPLVAHLQEWVANGFRTVLACRQRGQAQRLYELLAPYNLPLEISSGNFLQQSEGKAVEIMLGDISRGFRLPAHQLVVVAEEELFGRRIKRRSVSDLRKKQILTSLAELKPGDFMVHIDHGVALYRGLIHLKLANSEGDFLLLEYAGADKLYLPVDRLNLVQRYVGAEGIEPKVDKLGTATWERTKSKAKEAIEEMAEDLLKIYAARQVEQGFAFSAPDEMFREFEASFTYEETPDQQSAIDDVLLDMQNDKPMDRLVCGDVGYGKTEVAMRGAFKAVLDGKQVAILVPTTILAQQHLETFRERFKGYPVTVEMVSRFRTAKEQKEILARLKKGEVDVIIGTHRLLQSDVEFRDLGLLIIDEEQRFGVAHKEKLKKYRAVVDIMTLTATPIPRTLHMSLMGIRDLSIIDTPPVDRLAIKTQVARFSDEIIREAVMRELQRGGQTFFVHNRVQSIGAMAEHLRRIVPEAKIAVAHGQMEEKELEKVMLAFMHGEYNLLLCTTIIESGLDIASANTLIINRADTFGLAQLYQLRGRVGRSKQRAYAYFLIPSEGALSSDARERLRVIQEISELGAGFRIATHDLEIRGAGDLLGARQSGQIAAVGFELYNELMEEAIHKLKGETVTERVEPEINLGIPAFIPEDYVPDPNQRLIIYKKLTQAVTEEEIGDVMEELIDRFGKLPLAATYLLEVMKLRLLLKKLFVKAADYDGKRILLLFHEKTPVSPDSVISLIRQNPKNCRFTPDHRLSCEVPGGSFEAIISETRNVLKKLNNF